MNRLHALRHALLGLSVSALAFGCDGDNPEAPAPDTSDAAPDTAPETSEDIAETPFEECEFTEPACSDEQFSALGFSAQRSGGAIAEEGTTPGEFVSHIDATAGGFQGTLGYTYARFDDSGLIAVDISDEESLDSMDWDIAFRRFIVRLNSGVSGPSCVLGGRTSPGTTFDSFTQVPSNVTFRAEQYFIEGAPGQACELIPEPSGLGSPQTILSSYWRYTGCVIMTDNVYVIALRDGRHVKLQVLSYYDPAAQATCNATDSAPSPNGSGNVRVRWAFLD